MDKILETEEKIVPAPKGKEAVYPKGIRSVYKLVVRIGYRDETFVCAEVTHYNADNGSMIADNSIKNSKNPDVAWNAYRNAIKNNEWGVM